MNEISNLEEFPTVLDISETLIRSREVVNQSKSLVSKINSFNTFGVDTFSYFFQKFINNIYINYLNIKK